MVDSDSPRSIKALLYTVCAIFLVIYFLHSILIAIFHLDTMIKENNLTYRIINATYFFISPPMFELRTHY